MASRCAPRAIERDVVAALEQPRADDAADPSRSVDDEPHGSRALHMHAPGVAALLPPHEVGPTLALPGSTSLL